MQRKCRLVNIRWYILFQNREYCLLDFFLQYEAYCKEQVEALEKSGDTNCDKIYFVKQTIHNACGTIALIHAISNNADAISLSKFFLSLLSYILTNLKVHVTRMDLQHIHALFKLVNTAKRFERRELR